MLAQNQGADTADIRGRERVASGDDSAPAEPRHLDFESASEDLHRRVRVIEELERVIAVVGGNRDHRSKPPGIAANVQIVGGGHEDRSAEVGLVGGVMKQLCGLPLWC